MHSRQEKRSSKPFVNELTKVSNVSQLVGSRAVTVD